MNQFFTDWGRRFPSLGAEQKMLYFIKSVVRGIGTCRSPSWPDLKFKSCVCETGFSSLETYSDGTLRKHAYAILSDFSRLKI